MSRQKIRFRRLFMRLNGHLFGAALVFLSFAGMVWAVSLALQLLHSAYPFSDEIFEYISLCELYLVYGDSVLCALVLLAWASALVLEELGDLK